MFHSSRQEERTKSRTRSREYFVFVLCADGLIIFAQRSRGTRVPSLRGCIVGCFITWGESLCARAPPQRSPCSRNECRGDMNISRSFRVHFACVFEADAPCSGQPAPLKWYCSTKQDFIKHDAHLESPNPPPVTPRPSSIGSLDTPLLAAYVRAGLGARGHHLPPTQYRRENPTLPIRSATFSCKEKMKPRDRGRPRPPTLHFSITNPLYPQQLVCFISCLIQANMKSRPH